VAPAQREENDDRMSDEENLEHENAEHKNVEHESKLSDLADAGHIFDQTNGVVEGLEGDADTPEQVEKRTGNGSATGVAAAPVPGTQMPGAAIPVRTDRDAENG
jgi:hypothetical protein